MNDSEPIDELFRNTLKGYSVEPSEGLWKGISRKLLWREVTRFNLSNLSPPFWIGSAAVMALLTVALLWILSKESSSSDNNSTNLLYSNAQGKTIRPESPFAPALMTPRVTLVTESHETAAHLAAKSIENKTHAVKTFSQPSISEQNKKAEPLLLASSNTGFVNTRSAPVDCFLLTNIPVYSVTETILADTILSFKSPGVINKVREDKPVNPQFFSAALGIFPEITFHNTGSPTTQWNFWTNLRLSYHISRFSVSTGAGLGYAFDDGIYRIEYKSNDSTGYFYNVVSYSVNPANHEITYNTVSQTVYDSVTHIADDRARNRYTYIQIPLLFGYQLFETNRLSLTIQGGPAVSFYLGKKESEPVIDYPNARIIRIDNTTPSRLKTNWQLWLNLTLEYRLTRQFSLFAEPYYKYYFQPMLQQENTSATNPSAFGLGVGLQFNFGKKK